MLRAAPGIADVTALPRLPIDFGSDMMGIGLSLADIAMADNDTEVREALTGLCSLLGALRASIAETREVADVSLDAKGLTPQGLRDALAELAQIEEKLLDPLGRTTALLTKQKFRVIVDRAELPFGDDLSHLLKAVFDESLPGLREARLDLILAIADRAAAVNVNLLPGDIEAFKEEFRRAAFADTLGWQETAHLAASPANARNLLAAIAETDHVDHLPTPPS